jgi:hypothetical protein
VIPSLHLFCTYQEIDIMRTLACSFVAGALIFGFVHSACSDSDPDAQAVIKRGIQAAGGEANLMKQKTSTWKETGTYYGMGAGLPYTADYAMQYPDKFYMNVKGAFQMGLDGAKGWTKTDQGVKDMSKEELAAQQRTQQAGWIAALWMLKDKAYDLKSLPDAKVGDAAAHVIQVTRKDYPSVKLYFAKSSGLLIKSEYRTQSPELGNKEVNMEVAYEKHQDLDGAKVPQRVVIHRDGKVFVEAEMSDMQAGIKLDPKTFAKPAE